MASTLFALEQHFKERQKTSAVAEDSCTSKPCKWIIPRKRKGPVTPISEISFVKHDYAKEKKGKTEGATKELPFTGCREKSYPLDFTFRYELLEIC